MQFKSLQYEVKDVDENAGVVDIYVNAYGNKDSDGDISAEGAFDKTIKEDFHRIKHFLNHDSNILLGLPLEFPKDTSALRVLSKMNREKAIVRDTLSDYKLFKENGRTLEHSIGFKIVSRDQKDQAIITEYKLWEYSTLTSFGANEMTPFNGFKSQEDIMGRIEELVLMYNAKYSDNRLKAIEKELKALTNPQLEEPPQPSPEEHAQILLKSFRQALKLN